MLRKGDLVKWDRPLSGDPVELGVVLEDQKRDWACILVYWFDDGETHREEIEFVHPLRKQKDA